MFEFLHKNPVWKETGIDGILSFIVHQNTKKKFLQITDIKVLIIISLIIFSLINRHFLLYFFLKFLKILTIIKVLLIFIDFLKKMDFMEFLFFLLKRQMNFIM